MSDKIPVIITHRIDRQRGKFIPVLIALQGDKPIYEARIQQAVASEAEALAIIQDVQEDFGRVVAARLGVPLHVLPDYKN